MPNEQFVPKYSFGRGLMWPSAVVFGAATLYGAYAQEPGGAQLTLILSGLLFVGAGVVIYGLTTNKVVFEQEQILVVSRFRTKVIPNSEVTHIGPTMIAARKGGVFLGPIVNRQEFESLVASLKGSGRIRVSENPVETDRANRRMAFTNLFGLGGGILLSYILLWMGILERYFGDYLPLVHLAIVICTFVTVDIVVKRIVK